jgi:hypothetical protein
MVERKECLVKSDSVEAVDSGEWMVDGKKGMGNGEWEK